MTQTHDDQTLAMSLLDAFRAEGTPADFWETHLPRDAAGQQGLAAAFDRIGIEAFNGGDAGRARDAFWPLFLLRLELVKQQPQDRGALRDFASAEDLLGLAMLELGDFDTAEQMLSEALSYRRGLHQDEPADPHAAYLYGVALSHMAKLERARLDTGAERDWVNQARVHLAKVDAAWPGVSFIEKELAEVTVRLQALA